MKLEGILRQSCLGRNTQLQLAQALARSGSVNPDAFADHFLTDLSDNLNLDSLLAWASSGFRDTLKLENLAGLISSAVIESASTHDIRASVHRSTFTGSWDEPPEGHEIGNVTICGVGLGPDVLSEEGAAEVLKLEMEELS